jgi:hypothetical protein
MIGVYQLNLKSFITYHIAIFLSEQDGYFSSITASPHSPRFVGYLVFILQSITTWAAHFRLCTRRLLPIWNAICSSSLTHLANDTLTHLCTTGSSIFSSSHDMSTKNLSECRQTFSVEVRKFCTTETNINLRTQLYEKIKFTTCQSSCQMH